MHFYISNLLYKLVKCPVRDENFAIFLASIGHFAQSYITNLYDKQKKKCQPIGGGGTCPPPPPPVVTPLSTQHTKLRTISIKLSCIPYKQAYKNHTHQFHLQMLNKLIMLLSSKEVPTQLGKGYSNFPSVRIASY